MALSDYAWTVTEVVPADTGAVVRLAVGGLRYTVALLHCGPTVYWASPEWGLSSAPLGQAPESWLEQAPPELLTLCLLQSQIGAPRARFGGVSNAKR